MAVRSGCDLQRLELLLSGVLGPVLGRECYPGRPCKLQSSILLPAEECAMTAGMVINGPRCCDIFLFPLSWSGSHAGCEVSFGEGPRGQLSVPQENICTKSRRYDEDMIDMQQSRGQAS